MAKGRVAERSQMGADHTTPVGDGAAGTRGPAAPGSRDYQKDEVLLLLPRLECNGSISTQRNLYLPNLTDSPASSSRIAGITEKSWAEAGSARMSLLILVSIFLSAAFVMFLVYKNFPQLSEEERVNMKVPRDMDDAKALGKVLSKYKDTFYVQVLVAYFATYIFLQTFAIPGSIFLSILSGFLYPFPLALFLVCLCSGLGASFCYMLSYLVGRPVVYKYLTEKAVKWSQQVERHREHLINYIIFLRITPFLPNWFINITSPVINVPLKVFFIGTFLGVAPPSFVAIKAGTTLHQLTTAGEAVSWNSIFILMILAVLSILPAIFQKKLKQKFE
ncbi:transmembrane protein 41B isoform X1 [Pongo abelii]|uniref:transmembrane protein 41B isoform X1 n=1 Tax=Pongo abelii TaxID=9601 RepID=UPI0023E32591|nr:transmembrane protein 41B isoform X1 [Pongo pygmaeus]XP_054379664.1 transmembrane protein 41B isoform X1 [Pongo abelii]